MQMAPRGHVPQFTQQPFRQPTQFPGSAPMQAGPQGMQQFGQQPFRQPAQFPGSAPMQATPQGMPQFGQPSRQPAQFPTSGQPPMMAPQTNMPQFAQQPSRQPAQFPANPQPAPTQWQQPQQRRQQPQEQPVPELANIPAPPPSMPAQQELPERYVNNEIPAPPPTIRLQSPDEAPAAPQQRARLTLPAPEQLGIASNSNVPVAPPAAAVDWNDVHSRLQRLGAVSLQIQRTAMDAHRVTFVLASGGRQPQHVEAEGATQAAAVLTALQRAELLQR
jgi:hypothetical protein